jgi:hypothetical protein
VVVYGIQQVDKTGLGTQATFGIITDTHMKGNEYAWLTTIFFIFVRILVFFGRLAKLNSSNSTSWANLCVYMPRTRLSGNNLFHRSLGIGSCKGFQLGRLSL